MSDAISKSGVQSQKLQQKNVGLIEGPDNVKIGDELTEFRYEKHLDPLIGVGWTAEQ